MTLGEPLVIECRATQVRRGSVNVLARYAFRFHQGATLVYEGQTALWIDASKKSRDTRSEDAQAVTRRIRAESWACT